MTSHPRRDQLNPEELHTLAAQLIHHFETKDMQITDPKLVNKKLTHEIARLNRLKFAKRSDQLSPDQACLRDDFLPSGIYCSITERRHGKQEPRPRFTELLDE